MSTSALCCDHKIITASYDRGRKRIIRANVLKHYYQVKGKRQENDPVIYFIIR